MTADALIPENLLNSFHPAKDTLLGWLAARLDDQLLCSIAAADYGQDYTENFTALKQIRDTLVIPLPLNFVPQEVLEFTHWSDPDAVNVLAVTFSYNGHVMRAFACTVLLMAQGDPANKSSISTETSILIQLITSIRVLDQETIPLTLQLLTWCMLTATVDEEERPFFALAILLLAVSTGTSDGVTLKGLAEWVMLEESTLRRKQDLYYHGAVLPLGERWLFDLIGNYKKKYEKVWQELARQILLNPPTPHPIEAAESLRLIGSAITGEVA